MAAIRNSSRRSGSSQLRTRGGRSQIEPGRYDRNRRAASNASSSVSTAWSTAPQASCTSQPPSSCLVRGSPSRSTTGGPATNTAEISFTITE